MNIHEKLKEVQDYFKEKLLNGEGGYEASSISDVLINVSIDGYLFILWCYLCDVRTYEYMESAISLSFTESECETMCKIIDDKVLAKQRVLKEESERKEWARLNTIYGTTKN